MKNSSSPTLLLINPWIYDFTAFDLWSKPVGLLYLASYLRALGYQIEFIDCLDQYHPRLLERQGRIKPKRKNYGTGPFHREIIEKPEILKFIPRHFARYGLPEDIFIEEIKNIPNPDAVLVTSVMTYWYQGPQRAVEIIKEYFPDVPVILGGIYATLMSEHARQTVRPDYLMEGAAEVAVGNLLANLLGYSYNNKSLPKFLDDFPPPAFDLYSHLDYLVVMTSRGCPFRCTFCATDRISGPFVQRQPDAVVKEIVEQTGKFNVIDVAFYDDALLLNKKKHIIPILQMLVQRGNKLRFHTPNGLHARQIDREIANLFFRAKFETVRLSFESVSPQRFADMKNKVTPTDLEAAVRNLVKAGYQRKDIEAYVLMGLPKQPLEEVYQSIWFVHSLGIKVRLASFSPIPGTVDFELAVETGLFPAKADPLLSNKTIYPMYRTCEAFYQFHRVRQLVKEMNQAVLCEVILSLPDSTEGALKNRFG